MIKENFLYTGPFDVSQDDGWYTIAVSTPSKKFVKNYGIGFIGYTWEENGPSLNVRLGKEKLKEHIEKIASLPFVDVLYIRCDWKDVQSQPDRLDLSPVWEYTIKAVEEYGLRLAFRIQMSSPNFQPEQLAIPDFLIDKIPLIEIGKCKRDKNKDGVYREPQYDHPIFQNAFKELNKLLVEKFDNKPYMEFVDLMMYGFWGEGHSGNNPHPFASDNLAAKTFLDMAKFQHSVWKNTPLAVNTQPDINKVGNNPIQDFILENDGWLRTDSVVIEEPQQLMMLKDRPAVSAAVIEDGYYRHYKNDEKNLNGLRSLIPHVCDMGGNYWSLWTEADNLSTYYEKEPEVFDDLKSCLGYRLRPSWIWQRKRTHRFELIVALKNDGVASAPGKLLLKCIDAKGEVITKGFLKSGEPLAGSLTIFSMDLPADVTEGKLFLFAQLYTPQFRVFDINWACSQSEMNRVSFEFTLLKGNDKKWRNDI